jgi:Flp pilus assembly protein TadD
MSLLMDALKRAEKEKKKAAGNLSEGLPSISDEHLTGLEPLPREDDTDLAVPPSIAENNTSAVVAITSEPPDDDLDRSQSVNAALSSNRPRRSSSTRSFEPSPSADTSPTRVTAHTVFTVSQRSSRPRLVRLGVLAIMVLGFSLIAIWFSLHPSMPLAQHTPTSLPTVDPPSGPQSPVDSAPDPAQEQPAASTAMAAAPTQPLIETLESTASGQDTPVILEAESQPTEQSTSVREGSELPRDEAVPVPSTAREKPWVKRSARAGAKLPEIGPGISDMMRVEPSAIKITKSRAKDLINPKITYAYQSFRAGNYSQAEAFYRSVLYRHPDNRDALLGVAAMAVRRGRLHEAQRYYRRLLNLNPRDSVAMAALFNLQRTAPGEISESQIKLLLDREPNAPHLHFSLGNLYARQARWAEAEQSYFQAYGHDSQNPDYVFNLAVSLDQLGQTETALNYYRKALELADRQPVNFNTSEILARIRSLSHAANTR